MDNPVHLTVLEGWRQSDGTHVAALKLDLEDGWKTYWRAPGEGGIPPFFDLLGSKNLVDFNVEWPSPQVFDQSGLSSVGYKGSVILPVILTPRRDQRDIALKGQIEIGVCREVCLPITLEVDTSLPADVTKRQGAISAALASVPYTSDEAGVQRAVCTFKPSDDGMTIETSIDMPSAGGSEFVVIESANKDHWVTQTNSRWDGQTLVSQGTLMSMSREAIALIRSDLRITVLGDDYAVDIQGCTIG